MSSEEILSLYLRLTDDIHTYWVSFGALTALIVGWLLSRKKKVRFGQRIALSIGWFAAAGYLGASLMNRYRLVSALSQDVKSRTPGENVLTVIAELGGVYQGYEVIVWTSFGLISCAAMLLIWSNLAFHRENGKE
nr:putative integron gene cassette protein [uncultured bacterium]